MRPADVQQIATDLYVVVGVGASNGPMVKPTHHMRIERRGRRWYLEASSGQRSNHTTLRAARLAASLMEVSPTSDRVPGYSNFGGSGPFAPMGSPRPTKKETP